MTDLSGYEQRGIKQTDSKTLQKHWAHMSFLHQQHCHITLYHSFVFLSTTSQSFSLCSFPHFLVTFSSSIIPLPSSINPAAFNYVSSSPLFCCFATTVTRQLDHCIITAVLSYSYPFTLEKTQPGLEFPEEKKNHCAAKGDTTPSQQACVLLVFYKGNNSYQANKNKMWGKPDIKRAKVLPSTAARTLSAGFIMHYNPWLGKTKQSTRSNH